MLRRVSHAVCITGALLAAAGAVAQSSDPNSSASSPQDRVSGGSVRARAPGRTVQAAITRHSALIDARVNAARGGGQSGTSNTSGAGGSTGSGSGSGLGSLSDLLGQLGLGDSLVGLASLFPGLTGAALSTLGQGTLDSKSTTTDTSGDATDPRLTPLLASKNGGTRQDVEATSDSNKSTTRAQTNRAYQYGGGLSRLTKFEDRAQTTSDSTLTDSLSSLTGIATDPNNPQSFRSRLMARWSAAFFDALAYGFSQTQFQTLIKNILTPLILPRTATSNSSGTETTGTNTTGGNTTGGGTDTNTNTGTQTKTGGGIETLTEPTEETKTDSTL